MPPTPAFLDKFTFHLALHLLGEAAVLEKLNQALEISPNSNSESRSFCLYWRSKLLLVDPSIFLSSSASAFPQQEESKNPVFVDLTFHFSSNEENSHSPNVNAEFGVFLLDNPTCVYCKSSALTLHQLEDHAKNISIDLHASPSNVIASMVASALQALNQDLKVTLNDTHIQLDLFHADLEETGALQLNLLQKTSELNATFKKLYFWDLTKSQKTPEPPKAHAANHSNLPNNESMSKLEEWWQASLHAEATMEQPTLSNMEQDAAVSSSSKTSAQTTKQDTKTKSKSATRPTYGYSKEQTSSKRRKKSKGGNPYAP
jgi:thiol-disulfide isomerase/thioredoxin